MSELPCYLGCGFGVGVEVDGRGAIAGILLNAKRFPLREAAGQGYVTLTRPRVRESDIEILHDRLSLHSNDLRYVFSGDGGQRTIEIDHARSTIRLFASGGVELKGVLELTAERDEDKGFRSWLQNDEKNSVAELHISCSSLAHAQLSDDGRSLAYVLQPGGAIELSPLLVPRLADTLVVAKDPLFAAVALSLARGTAVNTHPHYQPLMFLPGDEVSPQVRSRIDLLLEGCRCESIVFAGIAQRTMDAILWHRADAFRGRCTAYRTLEDCYRSAQAARLPLLCVPASQLAQGLLEAMRMRAALAVDSSAHFEVPEPNRPHLVTFEGFGAAAVAAANYAFYLDADLFDVGPVAASDRQHIADELGTIRRIQEANGSITPKVDELREFIRRITAVPTRAYMSWVAFTYGMPYSLAYDRVVGHLLDNADQEAIIREVIWDSNRPRMMPLALLVTTRAFPYSEISSELARFSGSWFCAGLADESAEKAIFLAWMQVLAPELSMIVAHGGREVRFEDTFLLTTAAGSREVKVKSSNREIPEFASGDLDGLTLPPELVRRKVIGNSDDICGIMMNDALVTGDDLDGFIRAPRRWGAIVNNGCATWTSLATDFIRNGAVAYIGTLWPVSESVAYSVGSTLLKHCHEEPLAAALTRGLMALEPLERANYVLAGTASYRPGRLRVARDPAEAFVTIAAAQVQFLASIQGSSARMAGVLSTAIGGLQDVLHGALAHMKGRGAFLAQWRAELSLCVERKLGYSGVFVERFRSAIALYESLPSAWASQGECGTEEELRDLAELIVRVLIKLADGLAEFRLYREAEKVLAEARERARSDPSPQSMVAIQVAEYGIAAGRGDIAAARGLLAELVPPSRSGAEPLAEFETLLKTQGRHGGVGAGERWFEEFYAAMRNRGVSRHEAATLLCFQAELLRDTGQFGEALRLYEQSLDVFIAEGDELAVARSCNNMGIVLRCLGEPALARDYFARSLALKMRLRTTDTGNTLLHLAELAEDPAEGEQLIDRALSTFCESGNEQGETECLCSKGRMLAREGRVSAAAEYLTRACDLAVQLDLPVLQGKAEVDLGLLALRAGAVRRGISLIRSGGRRLSATGILIPQWHEADVLDQLIEGLAADISAERFATLRKGVAELIGDEPQRWMVRELARSFLDAGNYEGARVISRFAAECFDEEMRQRLLRHDGRLDENVKELALASGGGDLERRRLLGNALRDAGRHDEAIAVYGDCSSMLGEGGGDDELFRLDTNIASCLVDLGRLVEADELLRDLRSREVWGVLPARDRAVFFNNLGCLCKRQGKPREAMAAYKDCVTSSGEGWEPVNVLVRVNVAELAFEQGDLEGGLDACREVVGLTENILHHPLAEKLMRWRSAALLNSASIHLSRDETREATLCVARAMHGLRDAESSLWREMRGHVVDLTTALAVRLDTTPQECLQRAAREAGRDRTDGISACVAVAAAWLEGDTDRVLDALHALRRAGSSDLAISICDRLIASQPEQYRAHLVRGVCHSYVGDTEASIQDWDWCISRRPDQPVPYQNKARNLLDQERYEEAFELSARAITLEQLYADAYEANGIAAFYLGRYEVARAAFQRWVELVPDPKRARSGAAVLAFLQRERLPGPETAGRLKNLLAAVHEAGDARR